MKVKIQYLGLVKTYTNKSQEEVVLDPGATIADLLDILSKEFGEQFTSEIYKPGASDVKPMFTVMVNGIVTGQLMGVDTKLKEGDNIVLMPLMTGG